ncbi:putative transposon protein [Apostichopus japonicus]|uniref:Putative transposon protein n=1 Tax=Stichopus japonicus TaxID=307972 RepID=A0A2G8JPY4_STIJA|nr:putative transposon protein [Apostichopus japonicus]
MNKASTWPMYFTRGYMFHTKKHGHRRKTCNYGICVKGDNYSDASDEADFYGILTDIIQLEYVGLLNLKITLFKCEWYDPTPSRGTRKSENGVVDVLSSGKYYKYEPFILGTYVLHLKQIKFVIFPIHNKSSSKQTWLNVLKVNPRSNILGKYKNKDEIGLLQQENDEDVMHVQEIEVDRLVDTVNHTEEIDFDVGDAELEDEFQCNISSSDDDENEEM